VLQESVFDQIIFFLGAVSLMPEDHRMSRELTCESNPRAVCLNKRRKQFSRVNLAILFNTL
jgi:hypothetical protein